MKIPFAERRNPHRPDSLESACALLP
jgi:hypothetical protein